MALIVSLGVPLLLWSLLQCLLQSADGLQGTAVTPRTRMLQHHHLHSSHPLRRSSSLKMVVYSPAQGIPSALVEERDACGVGFIAALNNEPRHDIIQQALAACTCMVRSLPIEHALARVILICLPTYLPV